MKTVNIGSVKMPLSDYVVSRTALLGITKSGKTYTAKGIAEQLLSQDIPIIVFDAIGVWRHLKTPGEINGKGFHVVVAGGKEPDLPMTPSNAAEIVRAAMRENISLVIDLYDSALSKSDWRLIVQRCFRVLLYENKGLRHIFLEEAAEFAPQKVMDGQTYAEVEKLARMGGNASLGITMINQRAQELNKAVLELCDNVILLRQRGSHAIDSLEKWLDRLSPDTAKEIAKSMPHMKQGDCWIFSEDSDTPIRTRSNQIRSFHPDRTKPVVSAELRTVNSGQFVERLKKELGNLVIEQNDPAELKKRIKGLEKELHEAKQNVPAPVVKEVPALTELRNVVADIAEAVNKQQKLISTLIGVAGVIEKRICAHTGVVVKHDSPGVRKFANTPKGKEIIQQVVKTHRKELLKNVDQETTLGKCERAILQVLYSFETGCEIGKIALLSGYRISGSFKNSLSALRQAGFIEGSNSEVMIITELGAATGEMERLPRGEDFRRYWLTHSSFGSCERKILEVLINQPSGMSIEEIASATGYEISGSFKNALSSLRTAGVICGKNSGTMTAADEFFET